MSTRFAGFRGAGLRAASLGNTTELTRGAAPTLGREGRLKSIICEGIKKQRLCASWTGGSEVQQQKYGGGFFAGFVIFPAETGL